MKVSVFICVIVISLLSSFCSNEKPTEKRVKREQLIVDSDSISLVILENDDVLKDSVTFNNLVNKIVLNKELNSLNEAPSSLISNEIYKCVYQTPDSLVPLSRKMDLLLMLIYYYRHTADYYIEFISSKIDEPSSAVANRPFLMLPFIYTNKISPSIVKCILNQDSIQVPKEYFEYSGNVKKYISLLPKNNLNEAVKKIKTDTYIDNPNSRIFLSKDFQERYNHLPGWTIR